MTCIDGASIEIISILCRVGIILGWIYLIFVKFQEMKELEDKKKDARKRRREGADEDDDHRDAENASGIKNRMKGGNSGMKPFKRRKGKF